MRSGDQFAQLTVELLRAAEVTHADLIAVGRSTRGRHHLAGSVGRRLALNSKAPLFVLVP